jgi:hypothetical protein
MGECQSRRQQPTDFHNMQFKGQSQNRFQSHKINPRGRRRSRRVKMFVICCDSYRDL